MLIVYLQVWLSGGSTFLDGYFHLCLTQTTVFDAFLIGWSHFS